jgi:hypothetical protein
MSKTFTQNIALVQIETLKRFELYLDSLLVNLEKYPLLT